MKTAFRFIAAHNIVPVCITFVCYRYFSTLNHQSTDYFFNFGASFFCWLFYWIDKIRDNKNKTFDPSERHYLSDTDRKIQWSIGTTLAILTAIHFHPVPFSQLIVFFLAVPISLFYLMIANSPQKIIKELFSSLIISTTLCFIPIMLNGDLKDVVLFTVFFLMVFGNMLILGIAEMDYDLKHNFNSISVGAGQKSAIKTLVVIMSTILLLAILIGRIELIIWGIAYMILYGIILIFRNKSDLNLLHLLADAVFLFPLLCG